MENGQKIYIGLSVVRNQSMSYIAPPDKSISFETRTVTYKDTESHWAQDDISFVAERELFLGTGPYLFSPDTQMTRGMFVTVLGRLIHAEVNENRSSNFIDVPATEYYAPFIAWAEQSNIITGIDNVHFEPEQPVTREQAAAMLSRFSKAQKLTLLEMRPNTLFADDASISDWARDSVYLLKENNIVKGVENNFFLPGQSVTRAEVAALLKRFVETVVH